MEQPTGAPPNPGSNDTTASDHHQLSPKSPLPDNVGEAGAPATEQEEEELDEETLELLREMQQQEDELEAILSKHTEDAAELTRIRDAMASELAMLKQEAWKLQAMHDLQSMSGQLDALLEMPAEPTGAPAEHAQQQIEVKEELGALLEMEEAALDTELDELRAQLADIKVQASEMDKRRAELVEELASVQFPEKWDNEGAAVEATLTLE